MQQHLLHLWVRLITGLPGHPHERDERGDVPGWVLVTVMTAGLVAVLWAVAEDQLRAMLTTALGSVR
jgi:hypothetical protein